MFRLVSLNLNGIRSAANKGFEAWAEGVAADCMGVQEVKAQADTVDGRFDVVAGMKGHFHYAEKKGYSGVGLYSKKEPTDVIQGIGNAEFDAEGRYVEARFDTPQRKLSIVSCYFPSGSSGELRQAAKFRFLARCCGLQPIRPWKACRPSTSPSRALMERPRWCALTKN